LVNVLLVVLFLLFTSRVRLLIIIYGSSLHSEGTGAAFAELAVVSERVYLRLIIVVLFIISVFGNFDVWPLRGALVFFVT
jgi:hypothetical protein